MIKKIILVVVVIAVISGGTIVGLDRFNSNQLKEEANKAQIQKEEYKKLEDATKEQIKNKEDKVEEVPEDIIPTDPNVIQKEWRGQDGLTYKVDAVKNENGTYTGDVIGYDMYDNFIEFNFKFTDLTKRAFEDLLKK